MEENKVIDALLGVAVGDALGVPYEFKSKTDMQIEPAVGMNGYGTHNQPPGTWSDDSSLTFCLAESLVKTYDLEDIARNFIRWRDNAYWTADNEVFDIGITTNAAISELKQIISSGQIQELKNLKNYGDEYDNGNGSLMRIMPLLFYIKGKNCKDQFEIVWEVSALTHKHIRAAMSCMIYLKFAENLLRKEDKSAAYAKTRKQIIKLWNDIDFPEDEKLHFEKLIQNDIRNTPFDDLKSGGYVLEVLESSFWFFLNNNNYRDTVLSIINIGHDTDTSAAIAGGLAGLYYGQKGIPENWLNALARVNDIKRLGQRLHEKYCR